jgi:hypothetical protein
VAELDDETRELDEIAGKLRALPRTEPPSAWWWLLPPVAYVRRIRLRHRQRQAARETLDDDELQQLRRLADKARAWMFVAGGAFLIAITETWTVRESSGWDEWAFWALVIAMTLFCVGVTSYTAHRRREAWAELD